MERWHCNCTLFQLLPRSSLRFSLDCSFTLTVLATVLLSFESILAHFFQSSSYVRFDGKIAGFELFIGALGTDRYVQRSGDSWVERYVR